MTEDQLKELHAAEDFIAAFDPKDLADPDKAAELEAKLATAKTTVAQKRHYRDKFNELSNAGKGATGATGPAAPAPTAQEKKDEKKVDPQLATDFRIDHPELTKAQQLKVIAHAGAYGMTPEEALKDDMIQAYIKNTTTADDVDDASPAPARRAGGTIADKDWSNATPAEMDAARNKMLYPNG